MKTKIHMQFCKKDEYHHYLLINKLFLNIFIFNGHMGSEIYLLDKKSDIWYLKYNTKYDILYKRLGTTISFWPLNDYLDSELKWKEFCNED